MKGRTAVSARLTSLTLPGKAESVASLGSQCSYSSTIVHVGDKKPPPELGTRAASWRPREQSDADRGEQGLDARPQILSVSECRRTHVAQ